MASVTVGGGPRPRPIDAEVRAELAHTLRQNRAMLRRLRPALTPEEFAAAQREMKAIFDRYRADVVRLEMQREEDIFRWATDCERKTGFPSTWWMAGYSAANGSKRQRGTTG